MFMDGLRPIPGVLVTAQNHNRTKTQGLLAAALLPGPRRPVGESAARRRHRRRRHPPPAKTRPQVIQQATCKQHEPRPLLASQLPSLSLRIGVDGTNYFKPKQTAGST